MCVYYVHKLYSHKYYTWQLPTPPPPRGGAELWSEGGGGHMGGTPGPTYRVFGAISPGKHTVHMCVYNMHNIKICRTYNIQYMTYSIIYRM